MIKIELFDLIGEPFIKYQDWHFLIFWVLFYLVLILKIETLLKTLVTLLNKIKIFDRNFYKPTFNFFDKILIGPLDFS